MKGVSEHHGTRFNEIVKQGHKPETRTGNIREEKNLEENEKNKAVRLWELGACFAVIRTDKKPAPPHLSWDLPLQIETLSSIAVTVLI
jgi:hypothetical protein